MINTDSRPIRKVRVFDFDITYIYRPNDDIYKAIVPKELTITAHVPYGFNRLPPDEQQAALKPTVISELEEQVMFDTPDTPEFAIDDVNFEFEVIA